MDLSRPLHDRVQSVVVAAMSAGGLTSWLA
jgi:hypothetical protein